MENKSNDIEYLYVVDTVSFPFNFANLRNEKYFSIEDLLENNKVAVYSEFKYAYFVDGKGILE